MPRLPTYDAGNLAIQPSERGTDARLQEARRTGAFYNEAGELISGGARAISRATDDVTRSVEHGAEAAATFAKQQETYAGERAVSKGAAEGAKLYSNLTDQWDATVKAAASKDPNDPSVAAKFKETVLEPTLQQFKEAYSGTDLGRKWAEQHVESMRNHFSQKTSADMSTLAGVAVHANVRELSNSVTNTAFKSPDFHTVDYLLTSATDSVGQMVDVSNVKGVEGGKLKLGLTEKIREDIVKAGAFGAISKSADPERTADEWTKRYPEYVKGDEARQFATAAKTQAKTNLLQDKQLETYQRQQDDRAVHVASSKLMADNVSTDPATGRIVVKPEYFQQALDIVRQYPNAPSAAATVHSAITWGEHQQNQKAQPTISDPAVKSTLYSGMFDPNKPTTLIDLQRANVEGKLSPHDYTAMHGLLTTLEETPLKGEVMKDTLAAAKASLTYTMPGLTGKDPKGQQNYSAFIQTFIPEYLRQSRAGTLPANALDTRDPKSLISQSMAPFKRSAKQILQDRTEELSTVSGNTNLTGPDKGEPIITPIPNREIGKVYDLPKGKYKWTADGWAKP